MQHLLEMNVLQGDLDALIEARVPELFMACGAAGETFSKNTLKHLKNKNFQNDFDFLLANFQNILKYLLHWQQNFKNFKIFLLFEKRFQNFKIFLNFFKIQNSKISKYFCFFVSHNL